VGEPQRFHPLVGLGNLANYLEKRVNFASGRACILHRAIGIFAVALLFVPFIIITYWLCHIPHWGWVADVLLVYFAIGHQSLHQHARAVSHALKAGDEAGAKLQPRIWSAVILQR